MTKEETRIFKQNVNRLLEELNETAYTLYNKEYAKNNGVKVKPTFSQKTVYKILSEKEYDFSKNTAAKFVKYFNLRFYPPITTYDILHKDIFSEEHRLISYEQQEKYLGLYWIYYLSDNYDEIHGGVLKIWKQEEKLTADLVMGICEDKQMDFIEELMRNGNSTEQIAKSFYEYRDSIDTCTNEKLKHCNYCSGTAAVLSRSVNIEVTSRMNEEYLLFITLNVDPESAAEKYIGGLPVYMSPSCNQLQTRVAQMAMCRVGYGKRRVFSLENKEDEMELRQFLEMRTTRYHRFEVSLERNKDFQHLLNVK